MTDAADASADGAAVAWRYDSTTEPWLRALTAAAAALLFGPYSAVVLSIVFVVLVSGNTEVTALVALLALVGGPISVLYLWPLRDPDQRPALFDDWSLWWFDARQALAFAAVGAAVTIAATFVDPGALYALFLAGVAATLLASVCSVSGRVDPESGTIDTRYQEIAIADIASVRTHRVGPLVVVRPRSPGRVGTVPWYFLVPASDAPAVLDAVEAGIDSTPDPTLDRERNRTVRLVAGLLAVGAAGGGVLSLVAMDGVIGAYVGVIGLCGGGLFAFVAYEG
jgi:hypothetical protein